MIPRHQKMLFVILLAASLVMGVTLWHLRERAHQRLIAGQDSAPTSAPEVAPAEQATLLVANDSDGSHAAPSSTPCRCPPIPAPAPAPCWASCWTSMPLPMPPTPFPAAEAPCSRSFCCPRRSCGAAAVKPNRRSSS